MADDERGMGRSRSRSRTTIVYDTWTDIDSDSSSCSSIIVARRDFVADLQAELPLLWFIWVSRIRLARLLERWGDHMYIP